MVVQYKEVRPDRLGRHRIYRTGIAEADVLGGRFNERRGSVVVECELIAVEFPAREALVVWKVLKKAVDRGLLTAARRRRGHGAPARRAGRRRRPPIVVSDVPKSARAWAARWSAG